MTSNSRSATSACLVACQTRASGADRSGMMYTRANARIHAATTMQLLLCLGRKRDRSLNRRSLLINSRVVHLGIKRFSRNTVSRRFISRSLPDSERVAISQTRIYYALGRRMMTTNSVFPRLPEMKISKFLYSCVRACARSLSNDTFILFFFLILPY